MDHDEIPPLVTINRYSAVPLKDVKPLANALTALGFRVEQRKHELGIVNALEWGIPALFTLAFSGVGALSALTMKKYMDGFLEELGVKKFGSDTANALRSIFDRGAGSDAAYYRSLSERVEPRLAPASQASLNAGYADPTQKPRSIDIENAVYPPCLHLNFQLGGSGSDIQNPPWGLHFYLPAI